MTWRFIRKIGPDCHRLKTMVKRSVEQDVRNKNLLSEIEIMRRTPWSRIKGQNSVCKEFLEIVGNGKLTGKIFGGDNCSFRHAMNKRANLTQPNPSPRSSTQQSVKYASRTRSARGRSPSGKMARLPCKDYLKRTCTTPFREKWHPPECLSTRPIVVVGFGKSARMDTVRLMNSRLKGPKRMVTKVQ